MLIAIWPILIAVLGLLMWFMAANPKLSEVGKILFFVGALVTTYVLARHIVRIG